MVSFIFNILVVTFRLQFSMWALNEILVQVGRKEFNTPFLLDDILQPKFMESLTYFSDSSKRVQEYTATLIYSIIQAAQASQSNINRDTYDLWFKQVFAPYQLG